MKIVIFLVLALLILLFLKSRQSTGGSAGSPGAQRAAKPKSYRDDISDRPPFASVSIVPCEGACAAARRLEGKRFLESEAPITPLADCSCPKCRCKYVHYDDRRDWEDRRHPTGQGGGVPQDQGLANRRSRPERRGADPAAGKKDVGYDELLKAAVREEGESD